jgi:ribosome-binding factor A
MSVRVNKIENFIKEEMSLIFFHKIQDRGFGLVTITNVIVSPDLRHAKIYVSIYDKEKRPLLLEKINEIKSFLRSELAKKVHFKFVPELHFFIDDTLDYVEKMEGVFKKIHEDNNEQEPE